MNIDIKKGKKNKLKIGDKVKAKQSLVDYQTSHICTSYSVPGENSYDRIIHKDHFQAIYLWLRAKLTGEMPVGTVEHYGMDGDGKERGLKCVYIRFKVKTDIGTLVDDMYFGENDLEKIKTKKKVKG